MADYSTGCFDAQGQMQWGSRLCVQFDTRIKFCPHDASPKVRWMAVEDVMLDVKAVEPHWSDTLISHPQDTVRKNLDYLRRYKRQ